MQQLTDKYKNIDYLSNKSYRDFKNFNVSIKKEISTLISQTRPTFIPSSTNNKHLNYTHLWSFLVATIPFVAFIIFTQN